MWCVCSLFIVKREIHLLKFETATQTEIPFGAHTQCFCFVPTFCWQTNKCTSHTGQYRTRNRIVDLSSKYVDTHEIVAEPIWRIWDRHGDEWNTRQRLTHTHWKHIESTERTDQTANDVYVVVDWYNRNLSSIIIIIIVIVNVNNPLRNEMAFENAKGRVWRWRQ